MQYKSWWGKKPIGKENMCMRLCIKPCYNCCSNPILSSIHLFDVAGPKGASLKSSLFGTTGNRHGSGRLDEGVLSVGRKEGGVAQSTIVAFDSFLILSIFEVVQFNLWGRLERTESGVDKIWASHVLCLHWSPLSGIDDSLSRVTGLLKCCPDNAWWVHPSCVKSVELQNERRAGQWSSYPDRA